MDFDRICQLKTPAHVRCLTMENHRGAPVVVVIAKLGFRVGVWGGARLAPAFVRTTHLGWGARGSLRHASDWAAQKDGTDVVLVAAAQPQSPSVTEMDVSLRVGLLQKTLRVYGPRVYYQGLSGVVPGPPARLEPTPLQYENTYGGHDTIDARRSGHEARNPIGIGFALDRARLVGTPAPPVEDPSVAMPARLTTPASFGAIPSDWEPRRSFSGTYDERWKRERAPVMPIDADPRQASFAAPGLFCPKPLLGDEPVEVLGATPEGAWRFRLPRYEPVFACTIRGERRPLETHLDTFHIDALDPDERLVELTWRATIVLPRKWEFVESIEMAGKDRLPDSLFTEAGYQPPALSSQEASL